MTNGITFADKETRWREKSLRWRKMKDRRQADATDRATLDRTRIQRQSEQSGTSSKGAYRLAATPAILRLRHECKLPLCTHPKPSGPSRGGSGTRARDLHVNFVDGRRASFSVPDLGFLSVVVDP